MSSLLTPHPPILTPRRGIGVVELVVAVGIITTVAVGVLAVGRFAILAQRVAALDRRAVLVAAEGMATARFVRDANWAAFAALPVDTPLYPTFAGGAVSLSIVDPGDVDGVFIRVVTLSNVYRDGSGNITPTGTLDADARGTDVTVTWTDPFGGNRSSDIDAYLMNLN
ncbi:MAG: hypothetical protein A2991_00815 [Candidatus Terrybacteria bacterium RIFCSPLOWO2_01_FULL_58_14]|uniref:Type 4 fimbrial biogenesis protein PilX N-terminal domain-containing protein n=2 Tax=Candidatus Terryibacteriota TaxID=1817920 RepID=A0A1G2Q059_9BACT|nr:MAG: hypothetical protein A2682_03210 [Candidatus Terrybacteria bacterium RIFCSPHIGHO2_01_FULL_58_15]OHA53222.1 MAG: hypothetical protein A2991_00815 [Candidatus Terrybacteria bacterium RIFCSPLOWO2_01_FULL_58_14]